MPLRYIAQIWSVDLRLFISVPKAIQEYSFGEKEYDCTVVRWWSGDKARDLSIMEDTTLQRRGLKIPLSINEVCKNHGFVKGDFLEIVFHSVSVKRKGFFIDKLEEEALFPERTIEELAFDPGK